MAKAKKGAVPPQFAKKAKSKKVAVKPGDVAPPGDMPKGASDFVSRMIASRASKTPAQGMTAAKKSKMKPKMKPKTYKGKSTAPGGGGSFQMAVDAMVRQGMDPKKAAGIAATQGRAKYGAKKFAGFAAAGKKRAAAKKSKK